MFMCLVKIKNINISRTILKAVTAKASFRYKICSLDLSHLRTFQFKFGTHSFGAIAKQLLNQNLICSLLKNVMLSWRVCELQAWASTELYQNYILCTLSNVVCFM